MGTQARLKWVRKKDSSYFLESKIMGTVYIKRIQEMSSRTEMGTVPD